MIGERGRISTRSGFALGLIFCAALYPAFTYGSTEYPDILAPGEGGVLEQAQALVLTACILLAARLCLRTHGLQRGWLALVTAGLVVLLGEEISWGQHLLGWASPEWFLEHNRQGETNLHNASWAVNELPRDIVRLGIIVGGLAYPLVRSGLRREPSWLPRWLLPGVLCVPPALFMTVAMLANRFEAVREWQNQITYFELSEVEELYMYLFFLSYLIGMRRQTRA